MNQVWIFNGTGGHFPSGVFTRRSIAEDLIRQHKLTGVLTAYPVDQGCFDWAVERGLTNLKPEKLAVKRTDPAFIGAFTTASQAHYHYEHGEAG